MNHNNNNITTTSKSSDQENLVGRTTTTTVVDHKNNNTDVSSNMDDGNRLSLLPTGIVEQLEIGAFRSLCTHLQERSHLVSNMDLMTVSGFCRNCLAKWMVVEARKLVLNSSNNNIDDSTDDLLNQITYNDTAEYVYGIEYNAWKERYQKKATAEQMEKYNASIPIHSKFDKALLEPRSGSSTSKKTMESQKPTTITKPIVEESKTGVMAEANTTAISLQSNVCCEEVDVINEITNNNTIEQPIKTCTKETTTITSPQPSLVLQNRSNSCKVYVAIITVSDRAYNNQYPTGDLSGPSIQQAIDTFVLAHNNANPETILQVEYKSPKTTSTTPNITIRIVPDDMEKIQYEIQNAYQLGYDMIITTGGTGFGPRDVTPEATRGLGSTSNNDDNKNTFLECPGLMSYVLSMSSSSTSSSSTTTTTTLSTPPIGILSRGIAGIYNSKTFIVNLPGTPSSSQQIIPILFPLAMHIITKLREEGG